MVARNGAPKCDQLYEGIIQIGYKLQFCSLREKAYRLNFIPHGYNSSNKYLKIIT